ncbi:MAG: hypothetical protein DLM59_01830 [Pseudonocardiales bacterium]|nr:MAG: hypothetical protein DLM59_01830 [Pseudonocardiales bacterium]
MAFILAVFAVTSVAAVGLSALATVRAQHRAVVIEVAARQRTLAERYMNDVLLTRDGQRADPKGTARLLQLSGQALLDGGTAPGVDGDDDRTTVAAAQGATVRRQLQQALHLIEDLIATGEAFGRHQPTAGLKLTAGEHSLPADPETRLRVLATLTSNVSLNAARTIAANADRQLAMLVRLQVLLGALGLLGSLLLAWLLVAATRRQSAHFRSLVHASNDLVVILTEQAHCLYTSPSVTRMVGRDAPNLIGPGFRGQVHADDISKLLTLASSFDCDEPPPLRFRLRAGVGWRELEATVTDLRQDRHVQGIVLNGRDVTERVALEEQLHHQAFHDSLTGLANRALFRDRLDHALARAARGGHTVAVLIADLDEFKQVNDTLGHDLGDRLLATVADRLAIITRSGDTVARLGGDEFAIILEDTDEGLARAVAERIVTETAVPVRLASRELVVGASVGVAVADHPGTSGEDLIRHADVAMYAAKHGGRNRFEMFHPELARHAGELLGLQHEIHVGLQKGEFVMYYQPEVDLAGGAILGVEALMRWASPTRGLVGPLAFIPAAESTAAIVALGEFALFSACAQTAQWQDQGLLPDVFTTWVNVSAKQLTAGGIRRTVEAALTAAGLPPTRLGVELTETSLVADNAGFENACHELEELHQMGIRIAIDDFGTGFSSLSHLTRFPVDALKVDRSFVSGIEHHSKNAVIAANIITLAHALGLAAIAEGIETPEQLAELQNLHCDMAQGFLFARPTPAHEVTALLATPTPNPFGFPHLIGVP